jgi:tetratricopeptide (TPR) repeat protein
MQAAIKLRPYDELMQRINRAELAARELGDKRRLARILHWVANANFSQGFTSRAAPALIENFRMASEMGDERLSIVPGYYLGLFMVASDPQAAVRQLDYVVELARKMGNADVEAHAISVRALAHARLGNFAQAENEAQQALAFSGPRSSPIPAADLYNLAAYAYMDIGDADRALEYGQRGREMALASGAIECACAANLLVGMSQLQRQKLPEAEAALTESVRLAEFTGAEVFRNVGRGALAMTQYVGGHPEALPDLEAALANSQAIGDPFGAATFAQMLGEIATQQGRFGEADAYFDRALVYFREHGMRPYLSRLLHARARLYDAQERTVDAEQARAEADALWNSCSSLPVSPTS